MPARTCRPTPKPNSTARCRRTHRCPTPSSPRCPSSARRANSSTSESEQVPEFDTAATSEPTSGDLAAELLASYPTSSEPTAEEPPATETESGSYDLSGSELADLCRRPVTDATRAETADGHVATDYMSARDSAANEEVTPVQSWTPESTQETPTLTEGGDSDRRSRLRAGTTPVGRPTRHAVFASANIRSVPGVRSAAQKTQRNRSSATGPTQVPARQRPSGRQEQAPASSEAHAAQRRHNRPRSADSLRMSRRDRAHLPAEPQ